MEHYFCKINVKRRGGTNIDLYSFNPDREPTIVIVGNIKTGGCSTPDKRAVKVLVSQEIGLKPDDFKLNFL